MKIGLFGGTFNPPHLAHMDAAAHAKKVLSLDRVILVPSSLPPHKELPQASPTPLQRLAMCKLAAEDMDGFEVSDAEIRRGGRSYTIDTLAEFRRALPDDLLWLLMGQDMAMTLDKWHKAEELHEYCSIGVLIRGDVERDIRASMREVSAALGLEIRVVDNTPVTLSSTRLRSLGRADMRQFVCGKVYDYIMQNHLYDKNQQEE